MEVKIIKCSEPQAWYSDLIGEVFSVGKWGRDYVLREDLDRGYGYYRHLDINDVEVLSE